MNKTESGEKANRQMNKLFLKLCRKTGKNLQQYKMVGAGDRVLLGLSGGKDSLILLETLADRKKHLPFHFDLLAVHITIREINEHVDREYLQSVCRKLDIPLHFGESEPVPAPSGQNTSCFACSGTRRKMLFETGKKLGCNRIALGHHRDDALETLLLNMIYHGSISSIPHTLSMFDGRIKLIRPFLNIPECELGQYAKMRAFRIPDKRCPHEQENKRRAIRELLGQMDQLNPQARKNLFGSMKKIFPEYLP